MKDKEARANISEGTSSGSTSNKANEVDGREISDGKYLVADTGNQNIRASDQDYIRRSDIEALIKMLKENGKAYGYSFGASMVLSKDENIDYMTRNAKIVDNLESIIAEYKLASISRIDHLTSSHKHPSILCHTASNLPRPLVVDSGASHHMISDTSLIKYIQPATGHVMIANGDKIPIRGVGTLKLFDKETNAFFMPEFTSNLLSVKKCTTNLNCNVIFTPTDVKFQDIESSQMIGKGVTKGDLYMQEDRAPVPSFSYSFSSVSTLNKNALWHARLGHPHGRALNLMLPGVVFENNDCES
ncbi:hypothetical protein N665_4153s0001 [Sinapis alba]|nr:hypothetical protein N665_4153s0001 [Sinapis alba]